MSSAFRITERSLSTSALAGLQASLSQLQGTQAKLSSGKAISRPSDSPSGTMTALRLRAGIDRADQLDRNASDGLARLGTTDSALQDGLDTLRSARNAVVSGTNAAMSPSDREALAEQVDGLRQSLLAVANTTYLDQPIFAGTSSASEAYDANGTYQGDRGTVNRTIAPGVSVAVNATGEDAFGPAGDDIFKTLSDISNDLRTNPSNLSTTDLNKLDAGYLRMQQRNQTNQLDAKTQLSSVEDVDVAATTVDLQMQEVAYQAALGATARSIQPSLIDFLK
jgi:flagellar hook-associated protein 3 FlgL